MKKNWVLALVALVSIIIGGVVSYFIFYSSNLNTEVPLPKQEKSEGLRGVYDIDKNINEKTIDNYLGRKDTVYRDVRMLIDSATWENKGGERELTGFVEGFEVVPYAYLTEFPKEYVEQKASENVSGLYKGKTLFSLDENGKYIFIMCGAGGYANFTKQMLVALGWNKDKIYNVGGYWNYEGNHRISTVNNHDSKTKYDFWKVNYHNIDFDNLTVIK